MNFVADNRLRFINILIFFVSSVALMDDAQTQPNNYWKIHDMGRPRPPIISGAKQPGQPPSDALILFNGKDLSVWQSEDGGPAKWQVKNGYVEIVPGTGSLVTSQAFGDCQFHVEWLVPSSIMGVGQGGGNSGIYFMRKYEVQVLQSYKNDTYPDGQAAAIYGQNPPLVNASRPPDQWQSYDIIFRRPRFDESGKLLEPAIATVFHNGVLVQDHFEMLGPTAWQENPPYEAHADRLPLHLQDHGDPLRFRNIWLRELERYEQPDKPTATKTPEIALDETALGKYCGKYQREGGNYLLVTKQDGHLAFHVEDRFKYLLYPQSKTRFFSKTVDVNVEFHFNEDKTVDGLTMSLGRAKNRATKKESEVKRQM